MRDGYRIFDADAHVVEPAGLFADVAPAGLKIIDLPPTTPAVPCGDAAGVADQLEHGFDAASFVRAMDREGIDACVVYPSMGLFVPFLPELDAATSARVCRVYGEWIAEYCATDNRRLFGVGIAPLADPERAADEVRRCAADGLVAVLVRPNYLYRRNLGDPAYDVVYDAVAETGMVLAVHEGLGVRGPTIGSDRFATFVERHAVSHPLEQMAAMASLLLGGALERHPTMRVAFLESGTGWLPYWLDRLDAHAHWLGPTECRHLRLRPSEYFARQCVISTDPDDALVAMVVQRLGADRVMWASDFPHPDARFPEAVSSFLREAGEIGLGPRDLQGVLWDTPVSHYGLADRVEPSGSSLGAPQ